MIKTDTYIFAHDQNIILDYLNKGKFKDFNNLKYVFVGNRPTDKINNLDNVIIANKLPINIEHIPKLTSFTGWYALCENNLITSDYVNLFEYDINYSDKFISKNKSLINSNPDAIGYFNLPAKHPLFIQDNMYSGVLVDDIKVKTGVDMFELVNSYLKKNPNLLWQNTSNSTWEVSKLKDYVLWAKQFIDVLSKFEYAGHAIERSISFFYYINKLNVSLTNGLLDHLQLNSHKTDPFLPKNDDRFNQGYKKLI
jgi:hypothetical protein